MHRTDRTITMRVDTGGLTAAEEDGLVSSLLAVVGKHGLKVASIEVPLALVVEMEWAQTEDERCRAVKTKKEHATRSNSMRSVKGSAWRCGLKLGHAGMHHAYPDAKQSPWMD